MTLFSLPRTALLTMFLSIAGVALAQNSPSVRLKVTDEQGAVSLSSVPNLLVYCKYEQEVISNTGKSLTEQDVILVSDKSTSREEGYIQYELPFSNNASTCTGVYAKLESENYLPFWRNLRLPINNLKPNEILVAPVALTRKPELQTITLQAPRNIDFDVDGEKSTSLTLSSLAKSSQEYKVAAKMLRRGSAPVPPGQDIFFESDGLYYQVDREDSSVEASARFMCMRPELGKSGAGLVLMRYNDKAGQWEKASQMVAADADGWVSFDIPKSGIYSMTLGGSK